MSSTGKLQYPKRRRREPADVQVVACPSAFPVSSKRPRGGGGVGGTGDPARKSPRRPEPPPAELLDWHETAKEVRNLGATAFEGEQKRNFKDEQYLLLTGRAPKKQRVPLPIVRGIRRAAAEREKKRAEEARRAGIVLAKPRPSAPAKSRGGGGADRASRLFGPAPSIGAMHDGILKLKRKPK
jgi:hypothetical protein